MLGNLYSSTMLRLIYLALFTFTTTTACSARFPADISVSAIEKKTRDEINSIIGKDSKLPIMDYWVSGDFLHVQILSSDNLEKYAQETGSTLFVNFNFCDMPKTVALLGLSDLYVGGVNISRSLNDEYHDDREKYKYSLVLFDSWGKKRPLPKALRIDSKQEFYYLYDLKAEPMDVCLSIEGSNMVRKFSSYTIRISKKQLLEALK